VPLSVKHFHDSSHTIVSSFGLGKGWHWCYVDQSSCTFPKETFVTKIHVHKSGEAGIFANAYAVETKNSLVVIDTTLTVSEARAFGQELEALRKPVAAVMITHAHPDHVAGLSVWLTNPDTPVYALASVHRLLNAIEEPKRAQWQPVFKDEWVLKWKLPNRLVKDGETVEVDGTRFRVHELGPGGDCDANSIWIMTGDLPAVFAGDLVFNGTHSYLADGHTTEWLRNLERVRSLIPTGATLYPGHGDPGDLSLLDAQAKYLNFFRAAVRELSGGRSALTDSEQSELVRRMESLVPGGKLSFMIGLSASKVAAELAAEGQRKDR
jgi:glyoxylase-like metal-dependent hydrolase (beta-lactamase superfamily II)